MTKMAVVETSGTQVLVSEGESFYTDRRPEEKGDKVVLDNVLAILDGDSVTLGKPQVEGAKVTCKVAAQVKAPKVRVLKYKPKKNYRVRSGHRQAYTQLVVEKIEG